MSSLSDEAGITLDTIRSLCEEVQLLRTSIYASQRRVSEAAGKVSEIHPLLRTQLAHAVELSSSVTPDVQSASHDLLSTRIDKSLQTLLSTRARTHHSLYNHSPAAKPNATLNLALVEALEKLRTEKRRLCDEEKDVDRQLHEYTEMLQIIDDTTGGFALVVEDWARAQGEIEDCRKDLMRLGWDGDLRDRAP